MFWCKNWPRFPPNQPSEGDLTASSAIMFVWPTSGELTDWFNCPTGHTACSRNNPSSQSRSSAATLSSARAADPRDAVPAEFSSFRHKPDEIWEISVSGLSFSSLHQCYKPSWQPLRFVCSFAHHVCAAESTSCPLAWWHRAVHPCVCCMCAYEADFPTKHHLNYGGRSLSAGFAL